MTKITVSVITDGQFCDSCSVRVFERTEPTDEYGEATFFVKSDLVNNSHTDFFVNSLVHEDSHFSENKLIKPLVKIRINFRDSLSQKERFIIEDDILEVFADIDRIEKRIEKYKSKNPNSNIDEFYQSLKIAKSDIDSLNSIFNSLEQNFDDFEYKPRFHNWGYIRRQRKKLNDVNSIVVSLDYKMDEIDKVEAENELINDKLFQLDNDLFFDTGEYKIESLSKEQKQNLSKFKKELIQFDNKLHDFLRDETNKVSYCKLQIMGYTDGQKFTNPCDDILDQCLILKNKTVDPCNKCLSYLRANSIGEVVIKNVNIFESIAEYEIIPKGSELATNDMDNPELRKTELAYIISFAHFNTSIFGNK